MKCVAVTFFALLGLAAAGGDGVGSPVEKVVNLLKDLQAKITGDGKHENQIYNKYACWCETTTARKAAAIEQAEADLRSLGQQILKAKGKVATLTSEIQELTDNLKNNAEEQAELTSIRKEKNGKYMDFSEETKQAIAAMETAIDVLQKGSGTTLLQTDTAVRAQSAVQSFLDKIPSDAILDGDHMSFLSSFVTNGAEANFAPQSATIQGILVDMYDTFATQLETATLEEASQNKKYEDLIATKEQEARDWTKQKGKKSDEKANTENDLADATSQYDDTTDQMKADIQFFDETKEACDATHKEFSTRVEMREKELDGIAEALEILTSDDARDLFASSIKPGVGFFLQIESDNSMETAQAVSFKAFGMLKALATKSKSLRLASLAVQMRTAKVGHFDKVIEAIDDLIRELGEEGHDDIDKRDQCKDEYRKTESKIKDLDWKIQNNEAEINKLEDLIQLRESQKEETIQQREDTKENLRQITADRKDQHEDFKRAQEDDAAALKLLRAAKTALAKFDKEHLQKKMLLQKDPAFDVSEDQAPEAKFSDKGNRNEMSKGIVSLMQYIIEDLQDEVSNDKKDEARRQKDFEAQKASAEELISTLNDKETSLDGQIADRGTDKTNEKLEMEGNEDDLNAEHTYKDKITPDCDWILKNFEKRAAARSAEADGLVTAKQFLAGKSALLQLGTTKPEKVDTTDKLAKLHFLGLH